MSAPPLSLTQCRPIPILEWERSFLPRFETSSVSFQDPRTTSDLAGIRASARCRSGIHLPAAALVFFVRVPFHNIHGMYLVCHKTEMKVER